MLVVLGCCSVAQIAMISEDVEHAGRVILLRMSLVPNHQRHRSSKAVSSAAKRWKCCFLLQSVFASSEQMNAYCSVHIARDLAPSPENRRSQQTSGELLRKLVALRWHLCRRSSKILEAKTCHWSRRPVPAPSVRHRYTIGPFRFPYSCNIHVPCLTLIFSISTFTGSGSCSERR